MSEKMFEHKAASEGKIIAKLIDGELLCTNAVTAPLGTDLSDWLEFNNENDAKTYYGITDS